MNARKSCEVDRIQFRGNRKSKEFGALLLREGKRDTVLLGQKERGRPELRVRKQTAHRDAGKGRTRS